MNRKIFINADDFGWTDGHNLAIVHAHKYGALTHTSLISNGGAFDQAVELINQYPKLKVGIHLALNEISPLTSPIQWDSLIDAEGILQEGVHMLFSHSLTRRLPLEKVSDEWEQQITKVLQAGIKIEHLNSHKHIHIIPAFTTLFFHLVEYYGISMIRVPYERLSTLARGRGLSGIVFWIFAWRFRRLAKFRRLNYPDHFIGVFNSGHMSPDTMIRCIQTAQEGITEIMVHPAFVTAQVMQLIKRYRWAAEYEFEAELQTLCDAQVISLLHQQEYYEQSA